MSTLKNGGTMKNASSWCLGKGREPMFEAWSAWADETGRQRDDGKYICPDCGRYLALTSFGAGKGPLAFPPHKKPTEFPANPA